MYVRIIATRSRVVLGQTFLGERLSVTTTARHQSRGAAAESAVLAGTTSIAHSRP